MSYPESWIAVVSLRFALSASACVLACGCELVGGIEERELSTATSDGGTGGTGTTSSTSTTGGTGGVSTPCEKDTESDYIEVNPITNRCYRLDVESLGWDLAKVDCEINGGHLVNIGDEAEQLFIAQMLTRAVEELGGLYMVSIGLCNSGDGWGWVSNPADLDYDAWNAGEPNATGPPLCAYAFETSLWKWHDDQCEGVITAYLCEQ